MAALTGLFSDARAAERLTEMHAPQYLVNAVRSLGPHAAELKDVLEGLGRKVRGMVMLIMLMPLPIILLIIPLLQTSAIQPRYNLEEDVV